MPIKYIGRESHFHGKSIFEIARNLKNFGEGRYVYRVAFSSRYEEPSFYRLTSVVPDMNAKGYCKGTAVGEKIFRGRNMGICKIESGMKHDWRLIPKDQEQNWLDAVKNCKVKPATVVKSTSRLPPLMEKIFHDERLAYSLPVDDKTFICDVKINYLNFNNVVLDKDLENTNKGVENDTK
ncbi:28S ribosomal protein S34, mitochondrial-like [Mercenaria mercenaria]|uniref:28S ribosomal protein S34, mitochondrial-like n=1 Tax=Mercenaria mercenaria TaxID=6596 RepID=UPI00234F6B5E|nr:28S ribosomal protein S34, mitochondrial-like [Mercenaria mercenaria]